MITYFDAVIMGFVEGITEFLPVSSTGHLILVGELLGISGPLASTFEVVIQIGAILAVVFCYFDRFWGMLFPKKGVAFSGIHAIFLLLLTTIPGATIGFLGRDIIKSLFTPASVALALAVGAFCMLTMERLKPQPRYVSVDEITPPMALGIGCFQCLALWPGFSRSAATIMGGMVFGLRREVAAEYSFIAAVPIIIGAAGYDLLTSMEHFTVDIVPVFLLGILVSFIFALLAIKTFIKLLGRVGLAPFAWYRLLLVIPVYFFMVR